MGAIEYREGDGPTLEIPVGPQNVAMIELDLTLSRVSSDPHGAAAIPRAGFQRLREEGKIVLDKPGAAEA